MDFSRNIGSVKGKKGIYVLLSFCIPFFVNILAAIALHIAPFGDHNLAISDGKGYVYGLSTFARLVTGQEDWLYSLHGLGGNRWSSLAWGGIVPAKLLAVFAEMETAPDWMTWISAVNLALCGLTMYFLLAYVRGHRFSNLIFSTSYALIGFNVVNCFQMLFFIGPQLLPLMVLGLIRLLREKSPLTYILSLGLCIFFNFYFGFHLCVASFIFFAAYLYVEQDRLTGKKRKLFATWLGASVIAGLLPALFWLPALKSFSGGGRLNQTTASMYSFQENMPFIQIFSKLFSGANSTDEMQNGLPNIFCGILVVALVILFFMNRKIDIKKKKTAGLILGFYLLTFYITAFTLVMHGGTHTNWFPYRYSYVLSFVLILMAADEFEYLDEISLADTKKAGAGLALAAILIFSTRYGFVSGGSVILDFALLALMWLGFWLYKTKPETTPKRTLSLFLILLVCGNLYANYALSIYKVRDWELDMKEYLQDIKKNAPLIDAVQTADPELYRLEKEDLDLGTLGADPGFYNYYGVSGSGPTIRAFINEESCKIGINWWDMRHWYSEGIPAATDALLGLRYLLAERDLTEEKGYEKKVEIEGMGLYQNQNALPLFILSNAEAGALELSENLFDNLNTIWKSMTGGKENIFTEEDDITFSLKNTMVDQSITSKELRESFSNAEAGKESEYEKSAVMEYTFTAKKDGPIYVFDTSIPGSPNGLIEPAVRYVGYYHQGDTVIGKFPLYNGDGSGDLLRGYCVNQVFAYADADVLAKYARQLKARDLSITMEKESCFYGEFTAEPNQRILFTLPWDEGWTCCIDGKPVPIDKTWNLFMSVEVPEGHHSWEMKFFPAWMNYGLYISGAALLGLVVYMIIWEKKQKTPQNITAPETEIVEVSE